MLWLTTPSSNLTSSYLQKLSVEMVKHGMCLGCSASLCTALRIAKRTRSDPSSVAGRFAREKPSKSGLLLRTRLVVHELGNRSIPGRLFYRARRRPWLSAGVLGGSWGIQRLAMGNNYSTVSTVWVSFTRKAALLPGVAHAYPRVLNLFLGWRRGDPGSKRGPVGFPGARWMYMGTIKH